MTAPAATELPIVPVEAGAEGRQAELDETRLLADRYGCEFVDMDTLRMDQELLRSIPGVSPLSARSTR